MSIAHLRPTIKWWASRCVEHTAAQRWLEQRSTGGAPKSPDRASVLVIDDSDIDRATMASILSDAGFNVHTQPSPIGATKAARDLGVRVVVIDQNLPGMDGSKLALMFRNNPVLRSVRLILVSGCDEATMLEVAKTAQADAFIGKNVMHSQLAAAVRRLSAAAPGPLKA